MSESPTRGTGILPVKEFTHGQDGRATVHSAVLPASQVLCLPRFKTADILRLAKPPGLCRKARYLSAALSFLAMGLRGIRQISARVREPAHV